jgi:uncharacterized damage-inducible protein DinB
MTIASLTQVRVFESWQYYQEELRRVIAPLTEDQMSLRAVPGLRSLGEIAEHIVRARALWLPRAMGDGDWEQARAELEPLAGWDEPDDPPRTAAEVARGLDLTWRLITSLMDRWQAFDTGDGISDEEISHLRIVWGLMEHDLHHGGELSYVLGANGLSAPDM